MELTSARDDGSWTWRVAGARQPKGVLDGSLLYQGVKVGDVVRAEADFDLDGISVLAVFPPKEARPEEGRLELLGPAGNEPLVSTNLVPGRRDRPDRRRERPDRRPGGPGDRATRPGGPTDRPPRSGDRADRRPGRGRDTRGPSDRSPAEPRTDVPAGAGRDDRPPTEEAAEPAPTRRRERP
ncbi:MAG: hypothetical protein ACRD29_09825, partial [Acidimicrobiales bacterium]